MLDEKAWLAVSALIYPKGLCAGRSSSFTPNWLIHVCMDLALCTGAQSCWNKKGPSPNCFHKVGSMKLSKISWYAEAFIVPFTGTKGSRPAPEKQPHTIIPPPPNFTHGTMQSDKYWSPGHPNLRLVHQIARMPRVLWSDELCFYVTLHCSRVQWRCALHHCI